MFLSAPALPALSSQDLLERLGLSPCKVGQRWDFPLHYWHSSCKIQCKNPYDSMIFYDISESFLSHATIHDRHSAMAYWGIGCPQCDLCVPWTAAAGWFYVRHQSWQCSWRVPMHSAHGDKTEGSWPLNKMLHSETDDSQMVPIPPGSSILWTTCCFKEAQLENLPPAVGSWCLWSPVGQTLASAGKGQGPGRCAIREDFWPMKPRIDVFKHPMMS